MKGTTHRKVSPVATAGIGFLLLSNNMAFPIIGTDPTINAILLAGLGYISANWPDADQHAKNLPMKAILGRCKRNAEGKQIGYKIEVVNGKKMKKKAVFYDIKRADMRAVAMVFKMLGVKAHRTFLTHSPVLHTVLLYFLYNFTVKIPGMGPTLGFVILGLGLGYLTHLLADLPTDGGLPILPRIRAFDNIPILRSVFGDFRPVSKLKFGKHKFFLAGNQTWNQIFFLIVVDAVGCIMFPTIFIPLNESIWEAVKTLFQAIF